MSTSTVSNLKTNVPKLPTQAEVDRWLRERQPGLRVYNPTDQWLMLEVHGRTDLWAPPDIGGAIEPHPASGEPTVCDGMLEIRGRFLTQKDSSGKVITGQDAGSTVKYLVDQNQYGQLGLVWLPGADPEQDANLKEAGRAVWLDYQRKADEDLVARRREFKANWEKNPSHKGEPVPPPTEAENAATERLQQRKAARSFMYNCDVDTCPGYAANDWSKFSRHMEVAHGIKPKREMFDGSVGAFEGDVAKSQKAIASAAATVAASTVASIDEVQEEAPPTPRKKSR